MTYKYKLNLEDIYKYDEDHILRYSDLAKVYSTPEGKRYIDHLLLSLGITGRGIHDESWVNVYYQGRSSVAFDIARDLNYDFDKEQEEDVWF